MSSKEIYLRQAIDKIRTDRDMTITEVAALLKCSATYLHRCMAGSEYTISLRIALKIEALTDIPWRNLVPDLGLEIEELKNQ